MPDIVSGLTAGVGLFSSMSGADAAEDAANAQSQSAAAGIAEQRRQFDAVQQLLKPYVEAGTGAIGGLQQYAQAGGPALQQQQALIGLLGPEAQAAAMRGFEGSPLFQALTRQSENAILQNASATGGLRGGNVQGALAENRPRILDALIERQYGRLGGMTALGQTTQQNLASLGQSSAAGVGNAGLNSANAIGNLLGQQGAAQAGGILAGQNAMTQGIGGVAGILANKFNTPAPLAVPPPVIDDGYSVGMGGAYGGTRAGL